MAQVLICEADPFVRATLTTLVRRLGHEPIVVDADVIVPPRGDLLLLAPECPSCLECGRLVKAYFPDLPVVAMSALPESVSFLDRGPLEFLQKPFTFDEIDSAISRLTAASPV